MVSGLCDKRTVVLHIHSQLILCPVERLLGSISNNVQLYKLELACYLLAHYSSIFK